MIGLLQRPLPDNTQHSPDIHAPSGIRTRNPSKRPKPHAFKTEQRWFFSGVASIESMGLAVLLSMYSRASAYTGQVVYLTKIVYHVLPERHAAEWRLEVTYDSC
jgi:hypothetical protein